MLCVVLPAIYFNSKHSARHTESQVPTASDASARAKAELEAVGLGHRIGHYPTQLSGGEQQRVAIARAIAPRPELIFADEPTGNLDVSTGEEIVELLFARRAQTGATLLIITHDPALAERCDRVLTMADGVVASDRRIAPVSASEAAE